MVRDLEKVILARRMRSEGRLQREIAEASGVSVPTAGHGIPAPTLYDWRRELELPRNRRSAYVTSEMRERTRRQFARDSDGALRIEAVGLYSEGQTTVEIGRRIKVHSATICAWLRSAGVTPRRSPTLATRAKLRAANLGAKRWNWKGGITPNRVRKAAGGPVRVAIGPFFSNNEVREPPLVGEYRIAS